MMMILLWSGVVLYFLAAMLTGTAIVHRAPRTFAMKCLVFVVAAIAWPFVWVMDHWNPLILQEFTEGSRA